MKKFVPIICCILLAFCVVGFLCYKPVEAEAKNDNADIVGIWTGLDNGTNHYVFDVCQFTEDGIMRTDGYYNQSKFISYTYDKDNNLLTLTTENGDKKIYVCFIDGNAMLLFPDNINKTINLYVRVS